MRLFATVCLVLGLVGCVGSESETLEDTDLRPDAELIDSDGGTLGNSDDASMTTEDAEIVVEVDAMMPEPEPDAATELEPDSEVVVEVDASVPMPDAALEPLAPRPGEDFPRCEDLSVYPPETEVFDVLPEPVCVVRLGEACPAFAHATATRSGFLICQLNPYTCQSFRSTCESMGLRCSYVLDGSQYACLPN